MKEQYVHLVASQDGVVIAAFAKEDAAERFTADKNDELKRRGNQHHFYHTFPQPVLEDY